MQLDRRPLVVPEIGIEQGIKAARLAFPRVYFDKNKAKALLNSLKRYRRQINQATNEPGAPLHDAASHGADAFRYLAVMADQMRNDTSTAKIKYPKVR